MGQEQGEVWAGGQGGFVHTDKPTLTDTGADEPMTAHVYSSTSQTRCPQVHENIEHVPL